MADGVIYFPEFLELDYFYFDRQKKSVAEQTTHISS